MHVVGRFVRGCVRVERSSKSGRISPDVQFELLEQRLLAKEVWPRFHRRFCQVYFVQQYENCC